MNELIQVLTCINHYIQTQSSVSLEQIQNQLGFFLKLFTIVIIIIFYRYGVFHRNT